MTFEKRGRTHQARAILPAVTFISWAPTRRVIGTVLVVHVAVGLAACTTGPLETSIQRLVDANKLAADLFVQFSKAGDAANRAVMADTDEKSVQFAGEAEQATQAVQRDSAALRSLLTSLQYSNELRLLDEFDKRFAEYRALDRSVLDLAVENTNLKAQRLSFGPAREASDVYRTSLDTLMPARQADMWRVKALAASSVAAVRDIQVLQAPHIAEADDAAMTRIEARMATEESDARNTLKTLAGLAAPGSRSQLTDASAVLDRFMGLNAQIVMLSRRNTNVRSLALSLGQKRMMAGVCEDSLRALQDALSKRGFSATR